MRFVLCAVLHAANAFPGSFFVPGGKQQAGALIMRTGLLEAGRHYISGAHDHKDIASLGEPEPFFLTLA